MKKENSSLSSDRRGFLGTLATGAAALSLGTMVPSLSFGAESFFPPAGIEGAEAWFNDVKGKHKIVYDATRPHEIMPFVWPRIFLMTNAATGTPQNECSVVVILRHEGIPYAFGNDMWTKYNFGEMFKADTPFTETRATKNDFWQPAPGTYKVPGVGEVKIGINELQADGVKFCVCNAAMTVYSAVAAEKMNMKAEDLLKEWQGAVLPGIQIVPSGVWAVGRAQEHGCTYCFAG